MSEATAEALAALFEMEEAEVMALAKKGVLPTPRGRMFPTNETIGSFIRHLKSKIPEEEIRAPKKPLVVPSMAEAAQKIGCDVSIIKKARALGAAGFMPHGKVNVHVLTAWIKGHSSKLFGALSPKDDLELRKLRAQCRKIEFECSVNESKFVSWADVDEGLTRMTQAFFMALKNVPATLAPDVVGAANMADAEKKIRHALDNVQKTIHGKKWKTSLQKAAKPELSKS